jgi:hypothetical protein
MSQEHSVSRLSAGTMPGAPLAGISVTNPITATDQSSPANATANTVPNRGRRPSASSATSSPDTAVPSSITPTPPTGNTW